MAGVQLERSFASLLLGEPAAQPPPPPHFQSCLRGNQSEEAEVDVGVLYGVGRFKDVFRGKYEQGLRAGEDCVCKFLRRRGALYRAYFNAELRVVRKAAEIVDIFNSARVLGELHVRLNAPEVWKSEVPGPHGSDFCLIEPMISNFNKFNSNTGWTPLHNIRQPGEFFWIEAMQALSHFSFHCTTGSLLLCDLQGGTTEEGFALTDPVIMSSQAGRFGPADLGSEGISTFFFRHRCNQFCSGDWMLPTVIRTSYPCRRGSSMEWRGSSARRGSQSSAGSSLGPKSQDLSVGSTASLQQAPSEGQPDSQVVSSGPLSGADVGQPKRFVKVTICS